jgi:Ni/Co efflux regulator RcnB
MKTRWFLAVSVAAAFVLFAGGAARAQERHDRDDRHEHRWDRDRPVFDEHERVIVNGWWGERRARPVIGFRVEDRLPREWEPRLQVGFVLDNDWRRRAHPVPIELLRRLPPPPPHYTYYVIGGHVCLVDRRDWRVADVIHIEL